MAGERNLHLPEGLVLCLLYFKYRFMSPQMDLVQAVRQRFQNYSPFPERLLFGLSMLGVLDVAHLLVQKNRGFEEGCLGVGSLESAGSTFDCAAVTSGPGSTLFGVSNITWGLGFYLLVALLTVLVFWAGPKIWAWVQGARTGVLTGGLLYSGYLTYLQMGQIEALCLLCLGSALITALLFGIQIAILVSFPSLTDLPMSSRLVKRQVTLFVFFVAAALVILGADLVYFDGFSAQPSDAAAVAAGPSASDECQLNTSKSPVGEKGASLVNFQDITKGSSEAGVTVIEYFDPNCPHCKDFHQIMKKVVGAHSEEVRFVFKPFPLRRASVPEIQALYVAAQSGKFTEMLEAQYQRQGQDGINMSDLREIASEIDMDPDVLSTRVEENAYQDQVLRQRKRAVKIGVDSTPTVLVNGHFVQSRTEECMNTFIERAKAGELGGTASG